MNLNDETFMMLAIKYYDNPSCSGIDEFNDDLKKFQYLHKLFKRKHKGKFFNVKLALNHIIILYNLFGIRTTEFLFFKIDKEYWPYLKTFIDFLNYTPEILVLDGDVIHIKDIPMNDNIFYELQKI